MTLTRKQVEILEEHSMWYEEKDFLEDFADTSDVNREALLDEYAWVAGEHLRQKRGMKSQWDQSVYADTNDCGTACCVAGHVSLTKPPEGYIFDPKVADDYAFPSDLGIKTSEDYEDWSYKTHPLDILDMHHHAINVLGLTDGQAGWLFYRENDFKMVKTIMEVLLQEKLPKALDAVLARV